MLAAAAMDDQATEAEVSVGLRLRTLDSHSLAALTRLLLDLSSSMYSASELSKFETWFTRTAMYTSSRLTS